MKVDSRYENGNQRTLVGTPVSEKVLRIGVSKSYTMVRCPNREKKERGSNIRIKVSSLECERNEWVGGDS